jgi:DNA-binding Lrp family transcriptional regulator
MYLEKEILELLRREGPVTVYKIAKAFGITYGTAQWYISRLQRRGHVYTVRIGSKRYVALRGGVSVLQKVTVKDVLDEITRALSARGIKPEAPLQEALKRLEDKAPHVAEALRLIAERESH